MKGLNRWFVSTLIILLGIATLPALRAIAAEEVTSANLYQMIAGAKTSADHEAIATYYDKEAADTEAKAKLHHSTHEAYAKSHVMPLDLVHSCDELAMYFQRAADQAKALAAAHRKMVQQAK